VPARRAPARRPDDIVTAQTYAAGTALPASLHRRRIIQAWLVIVALSVIAMVILGGATRMTNSGLSIVEWKPVTGAIPPLSEAQWQDEFAKYRQIPQYQQLNQGMNLGDFKFIYWWEWSHRLLGRLIGVIFALPLALFWWRGWLDRTLKWKLSGLFLLGGSQGALGWWMVSSGLSVRTDVSQYRLAMHMTLASLIFLAIVWVAASLSERREGAAPAGLARTVILVDRPVWIDHVRRVFVFSIGCMAKGSAPPPWSCGAKMANGRSTTSTLTSIWNLFGGC